MPIFRTYSKSEQACTDAALLCEMGLDAVVVEDRAYGGNILGATSASIRIELPEAQMAEAHRLLAEPSIQAEPRQEPPLSPAASEPTVNLRKLLRWLLIYDLVFEAVVLSFPHLFAPEAPAEVETFLKSLAFSDALWRFAYVSYWPLFGLTIVANLLCLAELRIGRSLYAFTMVWTILCALGPPSDIPAPVIDFFGSLQWTGASIAVALMYWSPLRERFEK